MNQPTRTCPSSEPNRKRPGPKARTAEETFARYVDTSGGPSACHPWTGPVNKRGYGVLYANGSRVLAHRWALERAIGRSLGPGEESLHDCDNPPCCSTAPGHLKAGTHAENMEDMAARGRSITPGPARENAAKTHCKHGHELAGDNLYVDTAGKRQCRTCNARRQREFHARKRQQAAS